MSGLNAGNQVAKTIKLFIGGEFPRTESGRSIPLYRHKSKNIYAHLCRASRKDLRNAVSAAKDAFEGWSSRNAFLRGQILYRMAEMAESKREEFVDVLMATEGVSKQEANRSVDSLVDAFVYYAGFADKYQQSVGALNPVSGPHHSFTSPDAVGVVGLLTKDHVDLGTLGAEMAAIICSGNALVALMGESALIAPLAEVFATSDLPKGVVNLLTGSFEELYKQFGSHMEIQSISYQRSDNKISDLKILGTENMKRIVSLVEVPLSLEHVTAFVEYKTVWHPVGY